MLNCAQFCSIVSQLYPIGRAIMGHNWVELGAIKYYWTTIETNYNQLNLIVLNFT